MAQGKRKFSSNWITQGAMDCQKLKGIHDFCVVKELEWSEIPEPTKEDIDMEKKIQEWEND